jgi:ATP-dependent Lhr-like helicase
MNEVTTHLGRIKEALPHTWDAFFARFGRFTEIQARAIEPLLAGQNCVLVSATASGKTEAALAPLLELYKRSSLQNSSPGLALLYLVPTRALARDLARRLEAPLDKLAVRMRVKTGDEPALDDGRLPALLLTTPESFDSLLANRPRLAKDIRGVVIDELHIFDGGVRGDQLRILLNRLRRIKSYAFARGETTQEGLQYCALSATIDDPAKAAGRYFCDPLLIEVPGQRLIDAELEALDGVETLREFLKTLGARGVRKALAFCQRRAECEEWAHELGSGSPFGNRVYVHHASLAASVRRHVERQFALNDAALCFATSTLELGIDIGDVDLIIMLGPPDNTSAFLQRIGRGNRRTARTSVACFFRNEREKALFRVFIRAAQEGRVEKTGGERFRPSVIVQQLCSYIKQTQWREIDPATAYGLFASPQGIPLLERRIYDLIIEHLIDKRLFRPARGSALKPGPAWEELDEQRAIYTNLLDLRFGAVEVIDEMTGRKLGEVKRGAAPGSRFLFHGRTREVTRRLGRRLFVRTLVSDQDMDVDLPSLRTPWRPLSYALAQAMAAELGAPRARSADEIIVVREQSEEGDIGGPEAESDSDGAWIFHCAGDAWGIVLGDLLETKYRVRVEEEGELSLYIKGAWPSAPLLFTAEEVRTQVRRRREQFESWLDPGRFQSLLPLEARRSAVIEAFDVDGFLRAFAGRRLVDESQSA